jgi:hypothetical protein
MAAFSASSALRITSRRTISCLKVQEIII